MEKIIFIFLILYPFCIVPWGDEPYYTVPKMLYFTIFTLILWFVYLFYVVNGKTKTNPTFVEWLLFFFILWIVLSTIFSVNVALSLAGAKHRYEGLLAWISYVSIFYFTYRFVTPKYVVRSSFSVAMTASSVLVAMYAILQHFHLDFLPRHPDKLEWTRSYAFFDNPNFYGTFALIMLFIAIIGFLAEATFIKLCFYYGAVCIIFASLLYSLTRSAWLGSFVAYMLLTIFVWRYASLRKKWLVLSLGLAIVFLAINTFEEDSLFARAQSVFTEGEKAFHGNAHAGSSRFYIWKKSFPLLKEYYVFGSGPDTFGEVFPYVDEELEVYFGTFHLYVDKAHNEFLQMAITMGIPALCLYLIIVSIGIQKLIVEIHIKRVTSNEMLVSVGILTILIGYIIQAFFNISVITVAPYFWALLGVAYRLGFKKKEQKVRSSSILLVISSPDKSYICTNK